MSLTVSGSAIGEVVFIVPPVSRKYDLRANAALSRAGHMARASEETVPAVGLNIWLDEAATRQNAHIVTSSTMLNVLPHWKRS